MLLLAHPPSGMELFGDLVLADFLVESGLASEVSKSRSLPVKSEHAGLSEPASLFCCHAIVCFPAYHLSLSHAMLIG